MSHKCFQAAKPVPSLLATFINDVSCWCFGFWESPTVKHANSHRPLAQIEMLNNIYACKYQIDILKHPITTKKIFIQEVRLTHCDQSDRGYQTFTDFSGGIVTRHCEHSFMCGGDAGREEAAHFFIVFPGTCAHSMWCLSHHFRV